MSDYLPAPRSLFGGALASREDKAAGKHLATIQSGAFLQRAEDEAQLALGTAKMHDVSVATHHAFSEGEGMVNDFRSRVGEDPFLAKALAPFLERGLRGVGRQLDRLDEGW